MSYQYVVTFIGDDRTGIVGQLSATIEKHGGNWLESQLSQLGGKFAGLILIELESAEASALEADLKGLPGGQWSVRVTPTNSNAPTGEANLSLELVGPDRPGIVREVSTALAETGINVVTMESEVESAPFTGEPMFKASISAHVPETVSTADLAAKLELIAEAMTLDIDLGS